MKTKLIAVITIAAALTCYAGGPRHFWDSFDPDVDYPAIYQVVAMCHRGQETAPICTGDYHGPAINVRTIDHEIDSKDGAHWMFMKNGKVYVNKDGQLYERVSAKH